MCRWRSSKRSGVELLRGLLGEALVAVLLTVLGRDAEFEIRVVLLGLAAGVAEVFDRERAEALAEAATRRLAKLADPPLHRAAR